MIRNIIHFIAVFFAVLGMLLLSSCGSSRKSVSTGAAGNGWTCVYMPVNLDLEKPLSLSASGRATMVRDSLIHISVRFIGMEVAVIHANTDSVYIVDKYHKKYMAEPLSALLGKYSKKLTLGDLQDMMLGLKPVPDDAPAKVTATRLMPAPAGNVASEIEIEAVTPHGTVDASMEWKLGSAKWNEPERTASFSLPRGAQRIYLSSLKSQFEDMEF